MAEPPTASRLRSTHIIDLTGELSPRPPAAAARGYRNRNTFIDLTCSTHEPATEVDRNVASSSASDVEVICEVRRGTNRPPTRARRPLTRSLGVDIIDIDAPSQAATPVAVTPPTRPAAMATVGAAGNNGDSALPFVSIPGPSLSSPPKPTEQPWSCPICLESYTKLEGQGIHTVVITGCSHVFCERCTNDAIKFQKKCPKCRRVVRGKAMYKRLYF